MLDHPASHGQGSATTPALARCRRRATARARAGDGHPRRVTGRRHRSPPPDAGSPGRVARQTPVAGPLDALPMHLIDGTLVLSATDLTGFLACEHLAELDRAVAEGRIPAAVRDDDPELELL